MSFLRCLTLCIVLSSLGGCSAYERLQGIGETPKLTAIENPVTSPGYRPVSMPMPAPEPARFSPNSLWRNGARAFFEDQRARRVGDILTVLVDITDKAELENATNRTRDNNESSSIPYIGGLQTKVQSFLTRNGLDPSLDPFSLANSKSKSDGGGEIDREEKITTKVAAVVVQVLPNGNMVLEGRQEIRVNFEMRELIVAGVVRPEDITAENTIPIAKIAEARVSYGGRGQITDVQQPRYGQQFLDIILPF